MKKLISLTKRNCLVFLRDRGAVFFSLLAMLIVLMLMGVFLGNMNEENVMDLLKEYGGARNQSLDRENARHLVQYWTLAGILIVNAVTVTLAVVGSRVTDASEGKLASLYTAPVSRSIIALSYVISAALIGILMCALTFGAALCYIVATGGQMLRMESLVQVFLLIVLNVCIFSIIMYFLALFIKSSGAWSGIATVVGTLVGFVGAIYLPMGYLPEGVANVLKCLPVLHGASLLREACCQEAVKDTFAGLPGQVAFEYEKYMGIQVEIGKEAASPLVRVLFLVGCGILAFLAVLVVQRKKGVGDR